MVYLTIVLNNTVNVKEFKSGAVQFEYQDKNVSEHLTETDFKIICDMFEGKRLYRDTPSCGFGEEVSILMDRNGEVQYFCIAQDDCPILYWKNRERYFKLSDAENEKLHSCLTAYGFQFPCL